VHSAGPLPDTNVTVTLFDPRKLVVNELPGLLSEIVEFELLTHSD
jgi:hypothetical protein